MIDHPALHARLTPERAALADLASGRRWTYAELARDIGRCAGWLTRLPGFRPGSRIASLARNSGELAILHAACARAGCLYVPLNWRLAPQEIAALLADCQPTLLIADDAFGAALPPPGEGAPARLDSAALPALIGGAEPLDAAPHDRAEPSLILYTSGTSGQPKGVVLSELNLDQTAINFTILGGVGCSSVFLVDSPMFHVIGLVTSIRPVWMMGGCVLLSDGFVPARTLARLADQSLGVSHYFCVPQMAARLRADPAYDPTLLRGRVTLFTGGAPHAPADIRHWTSDGIPIVDGFGMTEAGTVFGMPADLARIAAKAGSAGLPTPHVQARIIAGSGDLCGTDEPGELQLLGPNLFRAYWNRPDETARAFTQDGWFLTGDIARRDADGFYTLVDRKKDMFISGGENIYPAEIEAALASCPGLLEAAVVGVPDAQWGEVGHCAVVPAAGLPIDVQAIQAHLATRIARYKLPRAFVPMEALPRTGSGKVQKAVLRRWIAEARTAQEDNASAP